MHVHTALIGLVYPAYHTFKAAKNKSEGQRLVWLRYWVAFTAYYVTTTYITDHVLFWMPFYDTIKLCILMWLVSMKASGAQIAFLYVLEPLLKANQQRVDSFLRTKQRQFVNAFWALASKYGLSSVATVFTLLKIQVYGVPEPEEPEEVAEIEQDIQIRVPQSARRRPRATSNNDLNKGDNFSAEPMKSGKVRENVYSFTSSTSSLKDNQSPTRSKPNLITTGNSQAMQTPGLAFSQNSRENLKRLIAQADLSDDGNDALRNFVDMLGENDDGLIKYRPDSDEELLDTQADLTFTKPVRRLNSKTNNNLHATKSAAGGDGKEEEGVTLAEDGYEEHRVLRERVRLQRIRP